MPNTPKLLPCPFCGSSDVLVSGVGEDGMDYAVVCNDCDARGPKAQYVDDIPNVDPSYESIIAAIGWNRRSCQHGDDRPCAVCGRKASDMLGKDHCLGCELDELLEACDLALPQIKRQPAPSLGGSNWPMIAMAMEKAVNNVRQSHSKSPMIEHATDAKMNGSISLGCPIVRDAYEAIANATKRGAPKSKQPSEIGILKHPPAGIYEGYACTCRPSCDSPCKGECGCEACHAAYADFLSSE